MKRDLILEGSSKATSEGQITVLREIREQFNIQPGDTVYFLLEGTARIILQKGSIKLS